MHVRIIALALSAAAAAGAAHAQPAPAPSCKDPHAHELDFWLGDWEIHRRADDKLTGHTRVRLIDGCVVREEWTGLTETGGSLNAYDPDARTWRRLWAGLSANVGDYTGRWTGEAMEFTGQGSTKGRPVINRLRLTPQPDGSVRQQFDTSPDGRAWTPFIDATYRRAAR